MDTSLSPAGRDPAPPAQPGFETEADGPALAAGMRHARYRLAVDIASLAIIAAGLLAALLLHLVPALLSGLLIAQLVNGTVPLLNRAGVADHMLGRAIALGVLAGVVASAAVLATLGTASWLTAGPENLFVLLQSMAEAVDTARAHLPGWVSYYLPDNVEEIEAAASRWLRANAWQLQFVGRNVGMFLTHIVVGMLIGGMIAYSRGVRHPNAAPLAAALEDRISTLSTAFSNIVFSQVRISALNTVLTMIYLAVILPLAGVELPFVKVMVAVTFIAGLLPVVGNLISNTVILLVSLSVSPYVALSSLAFLVLIHKLEYFANARIIGSRINSRAWELLLSMLVMEAAFGIPGLIVAPIYYAYLKDELSRRGLI